MVYFYEVVEHDEKMRLISHGEAENMLLGNVDRQYVSEAMGGYLEIAEDKLVREYFKDSDVTKMQTRMTIRVYDEKLEEYKTFDFIIKFQAKLEIAEDFDDDGATL